MTKVTHMAKVVHAENATKANDEAEAAANAARAKATKAAANAARAKAANTCWMFGYPTGTRGVAL